MTASVRAIFLHNDRLADLVLTLKFDSKLDPIPRQTFVFYGPNDAQVDYAQILQSYGIDCTGITFLPDRELWRDRPNWQLPIDIYRYGGWISQQLIKLIALDRLFESFDLVLIQDCDTFNVKPYNWIVDDLTLQMYGRPNTSHSDDYYRYVEIFTGHPRQTDYCFVSEFMPMRKANWDQFRSHLQQHDYDWLQFIDRVFQNQDSNSQIWFSEYEVLGNWNLLTDKSLRICDQTRFELKNSWQQNLHLLRRCNVVANHGSIVLEDVDHWAKIFATAID